MGRQRTCYSDAEEVSVVFPDELYEVDRVHKQLSVLVRDGLGRVLVVTRRVCREGSDQHSKLIKEESRRGRTSSESENVADAELLRFL